MAKQDELGVLGAPQITQHTHTHTYACRIPYICLCGEWEPCSLCGQEKRQEIGTNMISYSHSTNLQKHLFSLLCQLLPHLHKWWIAVFCLIAYVVLILYEPLTTQR